MKAPRPRADRDILESLAAGTITIAIDTEFSGPETLTIQAATRLSKDEVAVKVYRAPRIPRFPEGFRARDYVLKDRYNPFFTRLKLMPLGRITPDLSPVRLLAEFFSLPEFHSCPLSIGRQLREEWSANHGPANGDWDARHRRWKLPQIKLKIVCHFLRADLLRMFGHEFFHELLANGAGNVPPLTFRDGKPLGFTTGNRYALPVVEYGALPDGSVYQVQLQTCDTMLPFGPASLDRLSEAFLGFGKCDSLTADEKSHMPQTFRAKPAEAFGYAICDAINTLCIWEQMEVKDRQLFELCGCPAAEAPNLRSTLGARVASFEIEMTRRTAATGSCKLDSKGKLKQLMEKGGANELARSRVSRFGEQTGSVHGGLQFSRSPTKLYHAAAGMFRDVDMVSCYPSIIAKNNVYHGRPIILEPGNKNMELGQAVSLMQRISPTDGWIARVSGDIKAIPNALVPSTVGAITRRQVKNRHHARSRVDNDCENAKLFSRQIESGVVTSATWAMIQVLPDAARREYGRLLVDSLIFYPDEFIAADGPDYDRRVAALERDELSWGSKLDLGHWVIRETIRIGEDHVSLKFPLGKHIQTIVELRREAQKTHGKGSGLDLALKQQLNTLYGVQASRHFATNSVVASNVITAQARAEAFALAMALNALAVVTDGVPYRRDRIPTCTFAECVRRQPDYPLRHADAESGIPFLEPSQIPDDDEGFTSWYRSHVKKFFEIQESSQEELFGTHRLEHKQAGKSSSFAFDALCCDGSANYVKCLLGEDGKPQVLEAAMRGYGPDSKRVLAEWMAETYSAGVMETLPPLTIDVDLLSLDGAKRAVQRALAAGIEELIFPLGFEMKKVRNYRVIKDSAFICQSPEQWLALKKHLNKFQDKSGCGVELLSLRRRYGDRQSGSIEKLLAKIYQLVQDGDRDFTKALDLNRSLRSLDEISAQRLKQLEHGKRTAENRLFDEMDTSGTPRSRFLTGLILTAASCPWFKPEK